MMRICDSRTGLLVLCAGLVVTSARVGAIDAPQPKFPSQARVSRVTARDLLLQLALHVRETKLDCSHLVHELYSRVGLRYEYSDSRKLYDGITGFRRVFQPRAGDVVAWRGHVGIVVDPTRRTFVSALTSGVKVASYESQYWRSRGRPRFFRYVLRANPAAEPEFVVSETNSISPTEVSSTQYPVQKTEY